MSCNTCNTEAAVPFPPGLSIQEYRELALSRLGKPLPNKPEFKPIPTPRSISQHRAMERMTSRAMVWAYGITTVPSRFNDVFLRTLASLRAGGFDKPHLFIDGGKRLADYEALGLEMTVHFSPVRTFGNWILSLGELYIRNPNADRFAIFQDDFVTYRNLRGYLERSPFPQQGYLNLYTFPSNQTLAPKEMSAGWYLSNQLGRGAVALVFNREGVKQLLHHTHMINKPTDPHKGHKSVDGAISEAFRNLGWKEFVHNPSLVQHTGVASSMRNPPHPLATSFKGEDFDAMELLS